MNKASVASTWRDKLKKGYLYQIGSNEPGEDGRVLIAVTGYGGAVNYAEGLEKMGVPDELIQESILITQEEGIVGGQTWTPIKNIYWYKKEDT